MSDSSEEQLSLFGDLPDHKAARADRMGAVENERWGSSVPDEASWHISGASWVSKIGALDVLIGVDEAGRGPLAGPVSVAAVALSPEIFAEGSRADWMAKVDDSKKLTERRREALFHPIAASAAAFAIVHVHADHIDAVNILQATLQGMAIAVEVLLGADKNAEWARRPTTRALAWEAGSAPCWYADEVRVEAAPVGAHVLYKRGGLEAGRLLVDGNARVDVRGSLAAQLDQHPIKKGDALSIHIAAASVLAKVSRDHLMELSDGIWPGYGFAGHKGYPTKAHKGAIEAHGACGIHRRSFSGVLGA